LVSPYYNRPTPEGQYRHYKQIADSVELPLIIYNIPGRTGINIDNTTMLKLAQHRNIVGAKDATKDISQMMALLAESPANFNVLSGDDSFTYPLVALGGRGVISVAGNLVPSRMADLVKAGLEGDMVKARALHYELLPLFRALSVETNPIPIKAAMAFKGFGKEIFRLPMCPMSGERREALRALLVEMDLI
jgi:4-hydroxy-tetrahydrodipicolinate synthase